MTVGVQTFKGVRLRQARLARGIYKNALAEMIGVSAMAVTRYEDGTDKPHHSKLATIAERLNFPYEFFLQPAWPEPPGLVFWRSRAAETKYAREMTEQRMTWLCEIFSYFEREVDFPTFSLPTLDLPQDFRATSFISIEKAAEKLRAAWGLHEHPVPDMTLALENAGIPVVTIEISSDKQDGFCFRSIELQRPFVGINATGVSAARARYDAAHELGHIVLHRNVTLAQARDPAWHKLLEQQAHRFAGAFLFPQQAFCNEVSRPTLDYFCSLKKRWGISIGAMVHRAFDLELINGEQMSVLYRNMTRRRWRGSHPEPFDDLSETPLERPRMLRRAMAVLLEDGVVRRHTVQAALVLPDSELEQLIGLRPGFFQGDNITELAVRKTPVNAHDLETGRVVEFRPKPT